jgi:methylmalonyl-CoA mutase
MNDLKNNIRNIFPEIDSDSWLNQLQKDLKGATIEDSLHFHNEIEGIDFQSHFHWKEGETCASAPLTKKDKADNSWVVQQTVVETNAKKANEIALQLLNQGCTGIGFSHLDDADARYQDILFEFIHSEFEVHHLLDMPNILRHLPKNVSATFKQDPLSLGKSADLKDFIDTTLDWHHLRCFQIDNHQYASAGANIKQQLGILCAQVNSYFKVLTNIGVSAEVVAQKLEVNLGIGSNYLFEIAKFRAAQILFRQITKAYGVSQEHRIRIKATSLMMNKSLEDPYTNLLRLTTEGMSAVIGGADILELQPYDLWSEVGPSAFAYRMSNNISNLLMEESYFQYVQDAAAGSYSIEHATKLFAKKGYELFQTIEKLHGYNAALFTGFIENEIHNTAQKRIAGFESGLTKLVGINTFPNPEKSALTWKIPTAAFPHLVLESAKKGVNA